jgi:hypothetical protein
MKPKNGKAIGRIKSKTKRNHEIVNMKNKTRKQKNQETLPR